MHRIPPTAHTSRGSDVPTAESSRFAAPASAAIPGSSPPGTSHGMPYGRGNRDAHPDLRGFGQSQQSGETGPLLRHVKHRLAQEITLLENATPQWIEPIRGALDNVCPGRIGGGMPEIRLHRQFIAAAAMNKLAQLGRLSPQMLSGASSQLPALLLASFPADAETLKAEMGQDAWNRLTKRPEGYNALLTLMLLRQELTAYDMNSLVSRANGDCNHGQHLLALTNPDAATAIPDPNDRIGIVSYRGGWKNLDAGIAYLTEQSAHREHLLHQHRLAAEPDTAPEIIEREVDQAMPPSLSISRQEVLQLLSSPGGSVNLAAARTYRNRQSVQQAATKELLRGRMPDMTSNDLDRATDEAMAPFNLSVEDLGSILSHGGGENCLTAAETYLTEQFAAHTHIRSQLTNRPDIDANTIDHDVRMAMPPSLSLSKAEVVRILSYTGGVQSLAAARAYLDKLSGQRARLRQLLQEEMPRLAAGPLDAATDQAMARLTLPRADLPELLWRRSASTRLHAFSDYQSKLYEFYMAQRRALRANSPSMAPQAITQQLGQDLELLMVNTNMAEAARTRNSILEIFDTLLAIKQQRLAEAVARKGRGQA